MIPAWLDRSRRRRRSISASFRRGLDAQAAAAPLSVEPVAVTAFDEHEGGG